MEIVMKKMETFCPRKEHLTMVAAAAGIAMVLAFWCLVWPVAGAQAGPLAALVVGTAVVARLHLPHTGGFLHSGGFALGGICGGGFLGGFRRFDSRSRCFLRHRRCSRAAPGQHCRSHQTGQGHNFLFHHDFLLCFCFAYTHSIASPHQKVKASPKNHREILCHDDIISPLSFLFNTLYRTSCFPAPAKTYTAVRPQWSRHPR